MVRIMEKLGQITYPQNGDQIGHSVQIQGEIYDFPPNLHFWLAMQWASKNSLVWLKEPEIITKYWMIDIDFGNPTEDFAFLLLSVGSEGQCFIEDWYRFGKLTGSYPGLMLKNIPTLRLIYAVENLRLNK